MILHITLFWMNEDMLQYTLTQAAQAYFTFLSQVNNIKQKTNYCGINT